MKGKLPHGRGSGAAVRLDRKPILSTSFAGITAGAAALLSATAGGALTNH
jgi:hypothetical protein